MHSEKKSCYKLHFTTYNYDNFGSGKVLSCVAAVAAATEAATQYGLQSQLQLTRQPNTGCSHNPN